MKLSLSDLNNPKIFKHDLLGSVHSSCSPWSSQELEAAYQESSIYQQVIGSSIPVLKTKAHPNCTECGVCHRHFKDDEEVMLIPVTRQELLETAVKASTQPGVAICNCPNLLSGHLSNCVFDK